MHIISQILKTKKKNSESKQTWHQPNSLQWCPPSKHIIYASRLLLSRKFVNWKTLMYKVINSLAINHENFNMSIDGIIDRKVEFRILGLICNLQIDIYVQYFNWYQTFSINWHVSKSKSQIRIILIGHAYKKDFICSPICTIITQLKLYPTANQNLIKKLLLHVRMIMNQQKLQRLYERWYDIQIV